MRKGAGISYNPFFLIPFLLWVVVGGIMLATHDKRELFEMVNGRHTDITDTIMYYTTFMGQAEVIVPVLLLLMLLRPFRNAWYFATAAAASLIPLVSQQLLKSYFDRPRPLNYFHNAAWIHTLPSWDVLLYRSFPSGHSEGAFSFFCLLALFLPRKYGAFGLLFFILAISVCYSRLYLAAHFFEDAYVGSIIGMVVTTIIFSIMNKYKGLFFKKNKA